MFASLSVRGTPVAAHEYDNTYYFLRKHEYVLFAAKFISGDRENLPYIVVLVRMSVTVEAQLHKHLITIIKHPRKFVLSHRRSD
jgi:hypothetical protein